MTYTIVGEVWAYDDHSHLAGARFEVLDGQRVGVSCETDETGRCSLPGVFSGPPPETRASKDGFSPASGKNDGTLQNGSLLIGWSLRSTAPPTGISGTYTLTVKASSTCTALPAELRTRTYTVTISQVGAWASGPLLLYTGFGGPVVNDSVSFSFFNDGLFGTDGSVLEVLERGKYFTAQGLASGRVSESTIALTFNGFLSIEQESSSYVYTRVTTCQADDHQFTFVRR